MDKLRMQKRTISNRENSGKNVNLRLEHAALVEEIAIETGRTKTQVLGEMIRFAYEHIELYTEEDET